MIKVNNLIAYQYERVYHYKDLSGVYMVIDLTNGNKYIGSSKSLDKRLRGYENCSNVTADLKHGKYFVGVLEFCNTNDMLQKELHYIRLHGTEYYKGLGYNKRCPITNLNFEQIDRT